MSSQQEALSGVIVRTAVMGLALLLGAGPAMALSRNGDYIILVASGFLCDSGDSSACSAVVKSADGLS